MLPYEVKDISFQRKQAVGFEEYRLDVQPNSVVVSDAGNNLQMVSSQSFINSSVSASYALTASFSLNGGGGGNSDSSSWASSSISASYAETSSFALNSTSGTSDSASWASSSISASYAETASHAIGYATQQAVDDLSQAIGTQDTYLVSGGNIIWIQDYTYTVTSAVYYILGTRYTSSFTTLTLSGSDAANDRIDVIAVNNSSSVVVLQGTASSEAAKPDVDPSTQLELTFVYVQSNTTSPSSSFTASVYHENLGQPLEWFTTSSATTINVNSTNFPRSGSKCIEATSAVVGNLFTFVTNSLFIPSPSGSLSFYIRSKASWPNQKSIQISWISSSISASVTSSVVRGSPVTFRSGVYGFTSSFTTSYQPVVIPQPNFLLTTGTSVNGLQCSILGGGAAIGWFIDDVQFQSGTPSNTIASGLTREQADLLYLKQSSNLADVLNVSSSRVNLGLGTSATRDVGSGSNQVASGNHSHTLVSSASFSNTASHYAAPSGSGAWRIFVSGSELVFDFS